MKPEVDVDGASLDDLDVLDWVFVAFGVIALGWGVVTWGATALAGDPFADAANLVIAGFVALLMAFFAYESATPEVDARCVTCGTPVRVDSANALDEYAVTVKTATEPRRIAIGPVSVVATRNTPEFIYCSPGCAEHDLETPGLPMPAESAEADDEADTRWEVTE